MQDTLQDYADTYSLPWIGVHQGQPNDVEGFTELLYQEVEGTVYQQPQEIVESPEKIV